MSMPEFEATLRRVGDSIGLLVPHEVIEELGTSAGAKVRVVIPPRVNWTRLWGKLETKAATDDLIRRARTERD